MASDRCHTMESSEGDSIFLTPHYYGVFPRMEDEGEGDFEAQHLFFTEKSEVLRYMKANKKSRFKAFKTKEEAIEFSLYGFEPVAETANVSLNVAAEKSIFKAPRPQDLVRFRMAIENDDMDYLRHCINENPRYLIGSGDTPSILKEGPRYNALHVCAMHNNAAACNYILKTVSNFEFVERLYATNTGVFERCEMFLDLFLNTPDKIMNETPLHFASKYGHLEVIKELVLHKQCNLYLKNRFNQTPIDVNCTRANGDAAKNKEAINAAFEATFFVPILRSPDNAFHPVVGEPFIPNTFQSYRSDYGLKSPETPLMQVALAGPMKEGDAISFRKKLKTPPRLPRAITSTPSRSDPDKGIEKVGRALASEFNVGWKEYWDFLDEMVDLTSPEGLKKLESYLENNNFHQKSTAPTNQQSVPIKLYEVVGNQTLNLNALSPVSELCASLEKLHLLDLDNNENCNNLNFDSNACIINSYQVYANRIVLSIKTKNIHNFALAINHVQSFISSCSNDTRFSKVNFSLSHSMIATLVYNCISQFSQEGLAFAQQLTEKKTLNLISRDMGTQAWAVVAKAYHCIIFFLIDLLKRSETIENINQRPFTSCDCKITCKNRSRAHKNRFKKRLNFSADDSKLQEPKDEKPTVSKCDNDSDEYWSDSSSYSTPESTDESCDGESFFEAETGALVNNFIEGSVPTKTDATVFEAIQNIDISQNEYPFIFFYKTLCEKYFANHPSKKFKFHPLSFPSSPKEN